MASGLDRRFESYAETMIQALGHADRATPARWYLRGLMLPGSRKSVEPMAARVHPQDVRAAHQSMHHLVADSEWSDQAVLAAVAHEVLPVLTRSGQEPCYWIIDDTGHRKYGNHSVGVARQYCGQLGKVDNCQVAVSLSLAAGIPRGPVLMDAAYGEEAALRDWLSACELVYAVGIRPQTAVWHGEHQPAPAPVAPGRGRPRTRLVRDATHTPISVKALAQALPRSRYRTLTWREGTNTQLSSRFARVRVSAAHADRPRPKEWLLIEWPEGEPEPTRYFLSTLPADTSFKALVVTVKMRWRIERDYRELKQEVGLGHYEGRNWRGFHHHASLCIAAYGFLMLQRLRGVKKNCAQLKTPALPEGFRPRGSVPDAAPRPLVHRHDTLSARARHRSRS